MEVASELEVVPRLRWAVIDITFVLMVVMGDSRGVRERWRGQAGQKKAVAGFRHATAL